MYLSANIKLDIDILIILKFVTHIFIFAVIIRKMADHSSSDEWFVRGEDGCLPTGTPAHSVIYHPILNVILLVTKSHNILVIDVTSGSILQQSNLCGKSK